MKCATSTGEFFAIPPANWPDEGKAAGNRFSLRALWNATPRKRVNWCAVAGFGGALLLGALTWTAIALALAPLV